MSRADQTEMRGMSISDWSEGKWRKTRRDIVEKSYQGGKDTGGAIIAESINNSRADQEK